MRIILAALLLSSTPALAAPQPDPRIRQCTLVAQAYGNWAVEFRNLLDRNSTDIGGRVDQSFITDINFALVSAGDFVHTNIKYVQQEQFRGREPSVAACKQVTAMARTQIEQYARQLLGEIHPSDKWGRESLREEFRMGLRESTRQFQGN